MLLGGSAHDYCGVKTRDHENMIQNNSAEIRIYVRSTARRRCQNYPTDPTSPLPIFLKMVKKSPRKLIWNSQLSNASTSSQVWLRHAITSPSDYGVGQFINVVRESTLCITAWKNIRRTKITTPVHQLPSHAVASCRHVPLLAQGLSSPSSKTFYCLPASPPRRNCVIVV